MTDLRTPCEMARDEKHRQICAMYLALSDKQPDAAPHRIIGAIAKVTGMTVPGVKHILVAKGLYYVKKK